LHPVQTCLLQSSQRSLWPESTATISPQYLPKSNNTQGMRMGRWSTMGVVMLPVVALTACNPAHVAKQAKTDVDNGNAAACTLERANIQKAVENFTLLNPDTPVTATRLA